LSVRGSGKDAEDKRKADDDTSKPPTTSPATNRGDADDKVENGEAEVKISHDHTESVEDNESHGQRSGHRYQRRSRTGPERDQARCVSEQEPARRRWPRNHEREAVEPHALRNQVGIGGE
jgi:hypothetical protein